MDSGTVVEGTPSVDEFFLVPLNRSFHAWKPILAFLEAGVSVEVVVASTSALNWDWEALAVSPLDVQPPFLRGVATCFGGTIHSVLRDRTHHFHVVIRLLLRLCLLRHTDTVHKSTGHQFSKFSNTIDQETGFNPLAIRKLLQTWGPASSTDSCSVSKPKTTLIGTGIRTARLQASCTELLITRNHGVLASVGNASVPSGA